MQRFGQALGAGVANWAWNTSMIVSADDEVVTLVHHPDIAEQMPQMARSSERVGNTRSGEARFDSHRKYTCFAISYLTM